MPALVLKQLVTIYFKEKEVSITDCQELIKKSSVSLSPGFISREGNFMSKLPIFIPYSKWLLNAVWVQGKNDCVIQHIQPEYPITHSKDIKYFLDFLKIFSLPMLATWSRQGSQAKCLNKMKWIYSWLAFLSKTSDTLTSSPVLKYFLNIWKLEKNHQWGKPFKN